MSEPTDKELEALIAANLLVVDGGQCAFESWADIRPALVKFARAVLAKWGTPPAVAGEPVGFCHPITWRAHQSEQVQKITRESQPEYGYTQALYTTPQPTQAQAGAITPPPIECDTEELKRAYAFGWWSALEKQRETAQAGVVPLTDGQAKEVLWSEHLRWMRAAGLDTEGMCPTGEWLEHWLIYVRAIERAHGIKGGQHGAE